MNSLGLSTKPIFDYPSSFVNRSIESGYNYNSLHTSIQSRQPKPHRFQGMCDRSNKEKLKSHREAEDRNPSVDGTQTRNLRRIQCSRQLKLFGLL